MTGLMNGDLFFEEEILSPRQKYNEYVMTSLRTMWGFDLRKMNNELRTTNYELVSSQVASFIQQGLLVEHSGICLLTDEGKLFADRIAAGLFVAEVE